MSRVFGIVLAGGGGTRLGGLRKADLRIGGQRLIDRSIGAFRGKVDEVFVASGSFVLGQLPADVRRVVDTGRMGPLAGMQAAADAIDGDEDDILLFAAVDAPFLPPDYVPRLVTATRLAGASYAAWNEAFYPTNSAWRLATLRTALARHEASVGPRKLLQAVDATRIDWSNTESLDPFANLNTLADLIVLQRRALASR